jgi:hypothetical protein
LSTTLVAFSGGILDDYSYIKGFEDITFEIRVANLYRATGSHDELFPKFVYIKVYLWIAECQFIIPLIN